MKNKLFILCGKSASGKDTIINEVSKLTNIPIAVSSTTRPMRSNEENGRDYWFINDIVFHSYLQQGQLLEHTKYNVADGSTWYYCLNKNDVDLSKSSYLVILNVDGVRQVVNRLGKENVVVVYIDRDDRSRIISSLQRDTRDMKLILPEITRRFMADEKDFENVGELYDYSIHNIHRGIEEPVNNIKWIIERECELC